MKPSITWKKLSEIMINAGTEPRVARRLSRVAHEYSDKNTNTRSEANDMVINAVMELHKAIEIIKDAMPNAELCKLFLYGKC